VRIISFRNSIRNGNLSNFQIQVTSTTARRGPGSIVGIATRYGLDGPGIESQCARDFPHLSRVALLYNGYRVFSGGKEQPGRDADPSPPSSAVVMKG
jgi:hypothetical protein